MNQLETQNERLSTSTLIVTAHAEFLNAALDELKRLDTGFKSGEALAPGIALCTVPDTTRLMRTAAEKLPIFVLHLAPVQAIVHLSNTEQDVGELALAIAGLPTFALLERGQRFAVQTRLTSTSRGVGLPRPRGPIDSMPVGTRARQASPPHINPTPAPTHGRGGPIDSMPVGTRARQASPPHTNPTPAPTQVRNRPYTTGQLNSMLAEAIAEETGAVEHIKKPQIVVSLLCTMEKAYVGISTVDENLSDWPGGARHYAQTPEQISRSEFKLLEGLEVFGVTLPAHGSALDLGAAPGGWTRLLLEAGMDVVAVDPAKLDPRLERLPHLEHYSGYAEAYLDDAIKRHRKFDVIANDMRMDAREASRLLVQAATCLHADGFIISTLKLPHTTREIDPLKNLKEALKILSQHFALVEAHQLFHNRQEVTVITAKPRPIRV